ncbi:hypothetical protein [Actinoplanes sp. NPDC051851]|uniref:hypothetical protein n=1 Tax=Actinoplanes sp. NPDC051851 TaxID=3154753 RepID=UPI003428328F
MLIIVAILLAVTGLGRGDEADPPRCGDVPDRDGGVLTPYPGMGAGTFLRGASLASTDPARLLPVMRDRYMIDTVGLYHLDDPAPVAAALERLGMTAVVRLEEYDPATFAFTGGDADRLLARHAPLLAGLPRERIAYLAVNMPLDDPRVQARLGGVNSPLSAGSQLTYAATVVSRLRAIAPGVPVYLGVFYGWDGAYRPPSYRDARADGYFLTSYSYPGPTVRAATDDDATLIDAAGRRTVMDRFREQYGDAPVVIEYGVHTAEGHGGTRPAQDAGLVRDRAAKRRALAATTRFYCTEYPQVRGTLYFGFDVYKSEGDPPAPLDYGLS